MRWAVAMLWMWAVAAGYTPCLDAPAAREPVVVQGEPRALRVAAGNWDAAIIVGRIAHILLNDGVGVEAEFDHSYGGSAAVLHDLIGCLNDNCSAVADFPAAHMDFENWYTEQGDRYLAAQPDRLEEGLIGYDGQEGLYMREDIAQRAWEEDQLPIEFFRTLRRNDRSWMNYFNKTEEIAVPADSGCRGDTAARMLSEGFPCDADGWFYPDVCKADKASCIPVLILV